MKFRSGGGGCYAFASVGAVVFGGLAVLSVSAEAETAFGHTERDFQTYTERYEDGPLTSEAELVRLAELTLAYGDQREAARILEKEMKAGRVSRTRKNQEAHAMAWLYVREWLKAGGLLRTIALKSSGIEALWFKIAWTYFEREKWERAHEYLRRPLHWVGMKLPCRSRLALGHTLSNRTYWMMALKHYERAAQSEACMLHGVLWATYVRREGHRELTQVGSKGQREFKDQPVETPVSQPSAGDALKACQTALFELSEDETARADAERALSEARAIGDAEPGPARTGRLRSFEWSYLRVLARFNSGAVRRAERNITKTAEAGKQVQARGPGEADDALLRLLNSCEQLHKGRIAVLREARRIAAEAKEAADHVRNKN